MSLIKTRRLLALSFTLLFSICTVSSGLAKEGKFTTIDFPAAISTLAMGINPEGDIVGYYETADYRNHGFLLSKGESCIGKDHDSGGREDRECGKFSTIDFPGAAGTQALGINRKGDIVGSYTDANSQIHGFLLSNRAFTTIDFPITSYFDDNGGAHGINPEGEIVGYYTVHGHGSGYLLSMGAFTTFQISYSTLAMGINPGGEIVGYYLDPNLNNHGFLLSTGAFTTIDYPGAPGTQAFGIDPGGDIVGGYSGATGGHGFLLSKGAFFTFDVPGGSGTVANGINPKGDIVGYYYDRSGIHGFLLSN